MISGWCCRQARSEVKRLEGSRFSSLLHQTVFSREKSGPVPEGFVAGGSRERLVACHVLLVPSYGFCTTKGDGARWVVRGSRLLPNGLVVPYEKEKFAVGLATVCSGSRPGGGR